MSATAGAARAEGTEAPAAAPAAPPPATLAQADAPPPAPPPPPPVVVEPTPPPPLPPTQTEAMPATRPEKLPPISVGAWTRIGGIFQGSNPNNLGDWRMDNAYVELHAGGKIHEKVSVTLNLNGNMLVFGDSMATTAVGQIGSTVSIMDAIISFDPIDEFHLWAGRLLVPVDRANASGPFFMIPWNYPGFLTVGGTTIVTAPKEGPSGRNNGAVAWGDIKGGRLTYLAGVFDNASLVTSPLYSGRVRLALLDLEPGFWGNGSYFGEKNLFSIGLGGQYQKNGSATLTQGNKDWAEVNLDILFEKKLPGGGWVTGEVAGYLNNVHSGQVSASMYALAAYATPMLGYGNLQPMVRYQLANLKDTGGTKPWNVDVGLSYLVKGPALRLLATYSHTTLPVATGNITANSVQLGAQAIFF